MSDPTRLYSVRVYYDVPVLACDRTRTYGDRLKEGWNTIRSSGDRSHKDS